MEWIRTIVKRIVSDKTIFYGRMHLRRITGKNLRRRKLLRFEVHLADHCNLRCKHCDHFSPLADENCHDIETFERDCARLSELTDGKIELLYLLGGEPLLHPQISGFLDIARRFFHTGKICIITNGILLLKQPDEFWQKCKQNDVEIIVSEYPIKTDTDAQKHLADKHGVKLKYWRRNSNAMYRTPLDTEGKQDAGKNFRQCFRGNTCIFLQDGKLYTCATIPCIKHFNKYFNRNLTVTGNDGIDIYKAGNITEILDFVRKPAPFCRYCKLKETVFGIEWSASRKDISEWI